MSTREELRNFANYVLSDYDRAIDGFFEDVERSRRRKELKPSEVRAALDLGYGDDIADQYEDWYREGLEEGEEWE